MAVNSNLWKLQTWVPTASQRACTVAAQQWGEPSLVLQLHVEVRESACIRGLPHLQEGLIADQFTELRVAIVSCVEGSVGL